MQGGDNDLRCRACASLSDDDADGDADSADETEDPEVGEEDELPGAGLHHVLAHTEGDDELVAGDRWNKFQVFGCSHSIRPMFLIWEI